MEFTPETMDKLVQLLRPPEADVLQGEDLQSKEYEITATRNKSDANRESTQRNPRTIEEFEDEQAKEAEMLGKTGFGAEDRKVPQYSMVYQQAVTPEDVYLQMGPKTPSSASCEHLIVKIQLPGDKMENVDLTVNPGSVIIVTSQHHLNLSLPHEIDPDKSKANWDSCKDALTLTLKLKREFDYVNF